MNCIFHHNWLRVEDTGHSVCGQCFTPYRDDLDWMKDYPNGACPHSFKVCQRCGKAIGYGSGGELTVIPDSCKKQIANMGGR